MKADADPAIDSVPLVVLVNGQTASAGEVVAGALQDNQRAVVMGTRTVGKGSVQSLIKLDEGGAIKLTTAEYRLPSGRNIDKRDGKTTWGIDPDDGYFVPLERTQVKKLLDRQRERDIIGGNFASGDKIATATPSSIEEQEADPQLASALKALTGRLTSGTFTKVSELSPAQIAQLLKRDEIEQRRETALETLQKLDRELAELK